MPVWVYSYRVNADDYKRAASERHLHLSTAEIERVERFRHQPSRQTALLGRVLMRRVLARHLGCPALALEIAVAPGGKPFLATAQLQFNLSHSDDEIVLALGDRDVGVDIERIGRRPALDELARQVMHPGEWQRFIQQPDQARPVFFYRTWVLKEAYLKWQGKGIASGLKCIETGLEPPTVFAGHDTQATFIEAPSGYCGALVTDIESGPITNHRLTRVFDPLPAYDQ